jgi:toxin ParE1/3/4
MIERSSEAVFDLTTHTLYLHREAGAEVALRFLDSVEAALKRLEQFPQLGRLRHFRQEGLRSWPVPRFHNWIIFYLPLKNGVRVYRVLHGQMDLQKIL